jgi:hypothetical protein
MTLTSTNRVCGVSLSTPSGITCISSSRSLRGAKSVARSSGLSLPISNDMSILEGGRIGFDGGSIVPGKIGFDLAPRFAGVRNFDVPGPVRNGSLSYKLSRVLPFVRGLVIPPRPVGPLWA